MLQREVADRLLAEPGRRRLRRDVDPGPTPGRCRTDPEPPAGSVSTTAQSAFGRRPAPFPAAPVEVGTRAAFERVVRGLFLQRRKTLANALKPVAASFGRSAAEILRASGSRRRAAARNAVARRRRQALSGCAIVFPRKSLYLPAFCPFDAIGLRRPREGIRRSQRPDHSTCREGPSNPTVPSCQGRSRGRHNQALDAGL